MLGASNSRSQKLGPYGLGVHGEGPKALTE